MRCRTTTICCTVRGDLIRVLGNLMKRRDIEFDSDVLVKTSRQLGQQPRRDSDDVFMADEIFKNESSLDGIVTLVDAVWDASRSTQLV